MKRKNILIGGAWVYANGPLHIGHIAGLLPGDVIARYYRAKGHPVSYVSGSDCHGTPITIRAKEEGKTPKEISDYYHEEFKKGFDYLGFSYDYYGATSSKEHIKFCVDFHENLYESPYIYESEEPQAYCTTCNKYIPDRLIEGTCPNCGGLAKGDQCDQCGSIFHPTELIEARCHDCNSKPEFKEEKHLYLKISAFKKELQALTEDNKKWRKNAIDFTKRYLDEGLRDRAITRHLDWGIHVPRDGYQDKRIYIWAENVLGYLSSNQQHCLLEQVNGFPRANEFWNDEAISYYVHGKDNIPFHSIILPSLLLAEGSYKYKPDYMVSSQYLTLEGSKISTSENWAIWIKDLIDRVNPDALRYYILNNNPDKRDSDFSLREFYYANNSELLGQFGNLVNRSLTFIHKSFEGRIPQGTINPGVRDQVIKTYDEVGSLIEAGNIKQGLKRAFDLVRFANKYFDENRPWIALKEDKKIADNIIYNCVSIIENLALILEPFLPFSAKTLREWLKLDAGWEYIEAIPNRTIPPVNLLFKRLDEKDLEGLRVELGLDNP